MAERRKKKKRGARGGIQHQPGRGHDRKSQPQKVKRLREKAARRSAGEIAEAWRQWAIWDALPAEVRKFRGDLKPSLPRPDNG